MNEKKGFISRTIGSKMCLPQFKIGKFIYSEKVTKFCEIFTLLVVLHRTKSRWIFRKILWPSQNTCTLIKVLNSLDEISLLHAKESIFFSQNIQREVSYVLVNQNLISLDLNHHNNYKCFFSKNCLYSQMCKALNT